MNFCFISPNYPECYGNFCDRLKKNGVNVLGIGDAPYDELSDMLKEALTEYYKVDSLMDYDQVYKAVAYFAFNYGKIDWIESQNEFWLENDARLREDFNVNTGVKGSEIDKYVHKAMMHQMYADAMIPTAPQITITDLRKAKQFAKKVGYPVIVKPERGMGASGTWKIRDDKELKAFFDELPETTYVMEKFLSGRICAFNAIYNANGEIVFEQFMECDPIMDAVAEGNDVSYFTIPKVPLNVHLLGKKIIDTLGAKSGLAHIEFIKLDQDYPGIGKKGDLSVLEHNMRAPGGFTLDMMNFTGSCDIYDLYARMVKGEDLKKLVSKDTYYCAYAARKEHFCYKFSHEELMEKFGEAVMIDRFMPESDWEAMGQYMYIAKFKTSKQAENFMKTVLAKQGCAVREIA